MTVSIAVLWNSVTWGGEEPSEYNAINESYKVFAEVAERKGAEVFMAHYTWFSNGELEKAFQFRDGEWSKVEDVAVDVVYDKFDFDDEVKDLKEEIAEQAPVLNDRRLERFAADKLASYREFTEYIPETRRATDENVEEMLEQGSRVVIKPRSDYGGEGVKVIESVEEFDSTEGELVQRFVDSSRGVPDLDIDGAHDLRILVLNSEAVAAQIRQPDSGLISNVNRGGDTFFIDLEDVPDKIFGIVEEVSEDLSGHKPYFYSVDFIFDEEGCPWILEFNSKPGLLFYGDDELKESKKFLMEELIDILIKEF